MAKYDFCFSTVASRNYIAHAAGLWANIREIHPEAPLVVLALDKATYRVFSGKEEQGLICVAAAEAWGEEYWRNIRMRSNVPESAYASKSALLHWIVGSGVASATLLLDCDVVLLAPLRDLIDECHRRDLILVPTRHSMASWRRSKRAGLFSAGLIGLSEGAASYAAAWKAMCFELCTVLPIDGIYNEQKYLEYLIGHADTLVVRDPGVNVSATIFNVVCPEKDAQGLWRARDGTVIRMFHVSRTTDPEFELSRLKGEYDENALKSLGGEEFLPRRSGPTSALERDGKRSSGFSLGRLFDRAQSAAADLFRNVMLLQRVLQSREGGIVGRFRGAFVERKRLLRDLWKDAGITSEGRW